MWKVNWRSDGEGGSGERNGKGHRRGPERLTGGHVTTPKEKHRESPLRDTTGGSLGLRGTIQKTPNSTQKRDGMNRFWTVIKK